jgi:hypothetical protein
VRRVDANGRRMSPPRHRHMRRKGVEWTAAFVPHPMSCPSTWIGRSASSLPLSLCCRVSDQDLEKKRPSTKASITVKHPSAIKLPTGATLSGENERGLDERRFAALAYESSLHSMETMAERCFEVRKDLAVSLRNVSNDLHMLGEVHADTPSKT